jgi:hypothetical protein
VVAAHSAGQNALDSAIEFGNRLLTFPLAVLAFIACLRNRPAAAGRATWSGCPRPAGRVIAQAAAGGIVVQQFSCRHTRHFRSPDDPPRTP